MKASLAVAVMVATIALLQWCSVVSAQDTTSTGCDDTTTMTPDE